MLVPCALSRPESPGLPVDACDSQCCYREGLHMARHGICHGRAYGFLHCIVSFRAVRVESRAAPLSQVLLLRLQLSDTLRPTAPVAPTLLIQGSLGAGGRAQRQRSWAVQFFHPRPTSRRSTKPSQRLTGGPTTRQALCFFFLR